MKTNDELIAIFLGWTLCECGKGNTHYKWGDKNWQVTDVGDMKFSSDYNRLMKAVEKIEESTPDLYLQCWVNPITKNHHAAFRVGDMSYAPPSSAPDKKGAIYNAVVAMVKQLNSQTNNDPQPHLSIRSIPG